MEESNYLYLRLAWFEVFSGIILSLPMELPTEMRKKIV